MRGGSFFLYANMNISFIPMGLMAQRRMMRLMVVGIVIQLSIFTFDDKILDFKLTHSWVMSISKMKCVRHNFKKLMDIVKKNESLEAKFEQDELEDLYAK